MTDRPGCSRPRRVWHLRSGLRPSLRSHTRINHHPILSFNLVLKSGGGHEKQRLRFLLLRILTDHRLQSLEALTALTLSSFLSPRLCALTPSPPMAEMAESEAGSLFTKKELWQRTITSSKTHGGVRLRSPTV